MVLTALLGLTALASSSLLAKEVRFIMKFPTGMSLLKGDTVKIPITDYVQVKGAAFSTSLNNPSAVEPSLQYQQDVTIDSVAQRCNLVATHGSSQVVMVCNSKYFVRATMDHIGRRTEAVSFATLASTHVLEQNQECTDMLIQNGVAYVACADRTVAENRDVVVYVVNIASMAQASARCRTNLKSSARMTRVAYDASNLNKYQFILYEILPEAATPGQIPFSRCIIQETGNNTEGISTSVNLPALTPEESLNATIRGVAPISSTELLFVLAESNSTVRQSRFAILSVGSDGGLSKSKFPVTAWAPGSLRNTYDPRLFAANVVVNPTNAYIFMVGTGMSYRLTATFDRTSSATEYAMNIGIPSFHVLDCGFASQADVYVGRVTTFAQDGVDSDFFRQLIEYRSTASAQLKGFAVKFSYANYGCSAASGASSGKVFYGAAMNGAGQAIATGDDSRNVSYFKVQRESYLNVDTSALSEGSNAIEVSASLNGYETSKQTLAFTLHADYRDNVAIALQTKDIDVYGNSTFSLPYISSNFIGNDLAFATNSTGVVLHYSRTFYPAFPPMDLQGYSVERVFAVDHDTFVAVLVKPGANNKYMPVFASLAADKLTLTPSTATEIKAGKGLFKIFKLGGSVFCMVFKGYSPSVKKLTISCFDDQPDGVARLKDHEITDLYEVMDIQFLETKERVDFLMVAGVNEQNKLINKVIHYFVKAEADGKVTAAASAKPVDIVHAALSNYFPIDALFDYVADLEGSNHVTIKMISDQALPVIAKFNMSFDGDAVQLKYLRSMHLEHKDIAYCVTRNEAVLFNRKTNRLYAQRFDRNTGIPSLNKYLFPLKELGVQYVMQFLCMPEKGVFQILGVSATKEKFLITYRGGDSANSGRRVHSKVKVHESTNFIEHGYNADYVVTVAGGPGDLQATRAFVLTYPEGPRFFVDTRKATGDFSIGISAQSERKKAEETVNIRLKQPVYSATPKANKKFEIKAGAIVFLDDVATIEGPVLDVQLAGDTADLQAIALTKRNNEHRGLNIGDSEQPDKISSKGDFLVVLKQKKYVKFYGDPTLAQDGAKGPVLIFSQNGNFRDLVTVKLGYTDDVAVITKEFLNSEFTYTMHVLRKLKDVDGRDVFLKDKTFKVWTTKDDYEDIQATNKEDDIILAFRAKRELISNYIRLVAIKKDTQGYSVAAAANVIPKVERLIQAYSLFYIGQNSVAILACSQGVIGLQATIWDTNAKQLTLVDTEADLQLDAATKRKINVDYLKCWNNFGNSTVQCVFDAEGVTDFLVEAAFNPDFEVNGQDFVSSLKVVKSFQMPPLFGIKRVSRSGYTFNFLVEKNEASKAFDTRRRLQASPGATIDKFSDCSNLVLSYRPLDSPFIFTGITCSAWNKAETVDMSTEVIGGRNYIFYTKGAPADPSKVPAETVNDRISANYISGIVLNFKKADFDPAKVRLRFVGLNGQDAEENKQLTLDEFRQGSAPVDQPSSGKTWIWILVILLIIAVAGGVAFLYLRNKSGSSSSSDAYKSSAGNDKDDLEDIRL